jgi:hypothetical protein
MKIQRRGVQHQDSAPVEINSYSNSVPRRLDSKNQNNRSARTDSKNPRFSNYDAENEARKSVI